MKYHRDEYLKSWTGILTTPKCSGVMQHPEKKIGQHFRIAIPDDVE